MASAAVAIAAKYGRSAAVRRCALALAARALPAIFFRRRRTASVLPWMRVSFLRGAARRFFFFCFSTLRAERMAMCGSLMSEWH